MQKNNTAIICLSPNSGGMEIDTIKLAKKLSPYSQIVMVAKKGAFIAQSHESYVGINNIVLETISFSSMLSFSIIVNARKIIKKYNIKNVIFFGASEMKSLYFSFLGFDLNLIIRHGTTKSRPKKDWFHRLIYSKVDYHIAISEHIKENVRHIIPFGKNTKECLIYPSIEVITNDFDNTKEVYLLHTGRITRGKGQIDAIKACDILFQNNINFNFNIVGDYENEYEQEVFSKFFQNLKYKQNINLIGFSSKIKYFLKTSNIFIFPSYGEGFGNSFAEALGAGLICICYENTTFVEFKKLGFHIHLVENNDINSMKKQLLYVVDNIATEYQKSKKNIILVDKLFNQKAEIKKYLEILK